jgi:hypothetical protein
MTIKEMLPQMKQHLADGDAAFERRPRLIEPLIAYPRSLQGSVRNSRPLINMIELWLRSSTTR